jgi:succinate dehydrogenase/fumarate reductase flavoprotein subunit
VDRHTLPAFYRQKGVDLREEPVEVSISELTIRRSGLYFRGSGIAVDAGGQSSVEGLFSAGDSATVSGGIAGAATLGLLAGEGMARHVKQRGSLPQLDREEMKRLTAEGASPLERPDGESWRGFEDEIRATVTDYVGVRRAGPGLRRVLSTLQALRTREPRLGARNPHALMRTHEARNIRQNAELMAHAALERQETRTGSAHRRLDYPETNDDAWRVFVLLQRGLRDPDIRTMSSDQPLASSFGHVSTTTGGTP